MKKLLPILLLFTGLANAQIVNIPDTYLKAYLLGSSPTAMIAQDFNDQWIAIDANHDGEIQESEAQAIKTLAINETIVFNITGINGFSNLESLRLASCLITTLDVSSLTHLKTLACTNLQILSSVNVTGANSLTSLLLLDVRNLTTLTANNLPSLTKLFCLNTGLNGLTSSGLPNLNEILYSGNPNTTNFTLSGLPGLTKLNCSYNSIATLNVNGLTNLTDLDCSGNQLTNLNGLPALLKLNCELNKLTSLSINSLTSLQELYCGSNDLTTLNLSGLVNLVKLSCVRTKIANLSISDLPNLVNLDCGNINELTTVTLSNLPSLQDFRVVGNANNAQSASNLATLNLSGLPNLQKLDCSFQKLTSLNLNNLTNLKELDCSSNRITSLNLTNLPNLQKLTCSRNYITSLDASGLPALTDLACAGGYIVDGQYIGQLTSLNVVGLSNLKTLFCYGNLLPTLNLTGLTSLEELYCDGIPNNLGTLTSLSVNHLSNLKKLSCANQKLTSLNVSNLANLTNLSCPYNQISSLDLTGLTSLQYLDYTYNQLSNLNLVNLPSLTELYCTHNALQTLNVLDLTNLKTLICATNQLTTLNLSGLTSLVTLDISYNNLTLTDVSGLSNNLKSLVCISNNLSTLDVSNLPNLETLNCYNNNLTSLDVTSLVNLKSLDFGSNHISSIDVSPLINLVNMNASYNALTSVNIAGLNNLQTFYCGDNLLTSLDVTNHQALTQLDYSNNAIPNLDISALTHLSFYGCANTGSTVLDLSNQHLLQILYCNNNQLATLDVNNSPLLNDLRCYDNQLTTLFLKNGRNEETINLTNNPGLEYICADNGQIESIQTMLNSLGMNGTVSNSYCTFSPGGNHNTITGITIFDEDNNGCDVTDVVNPFIRLNITDTNTNGATVTNINGTYNFFTGAGDYTIAPNTENPTWFTFSPTSANFSFLDDNNNISTQNFCINAVGTHKDVEVVFAQLEPARPGFNAKYKIVFKNKGNQMQSGTVNLQLDDARTSFVSATPAVDVTAPNSLTWNYTNLMPFENRSIELTLNINPPTEEVETPVNNGDILNFIASIPVTGDEVADDNQFTYNQTVVGSHDPNDIICLEGEMVAPTEIGKYLHYMVNFENTGTFYAENVVVRLEIDASKFDMNSLQLLNSSNPSSTRIVGNTVEFVLQDINLAAASGNPPVGGHGDVLFKIRTKNDLQENDTVLQRAGIYFDYNFPVITNDAETTFAQLNNPIIDFDNSVKIYPNPTTSIINIQSEFNIESIQLYDMQGRVLETVLEAANTSKLDISGKSNGIYFLKIKTEKGSKVEKIVKE
ncbi:MAG: leucine-rich repeat domain-containing protein [Flavobacterium sp.]